MNGHDRVKALLAGKPVSFRNTREAIDSGVAMIHQELNLVPELSVYENIFLGREMKYAVGPFKFLDHKAMNERASELFEELKSETRARDLVKLERAALCDGCSERVTCTGIFEPRLEDVFGHRRDPTIANTDIAHRV